MADEKYVPEKGHRVRVVLEGEVTYAHGPSIAVGGYEIELDDVEVVSHEKVSDPLPTNYGAVIESEAGTRFGLGADGLWRPFSGGIAYPPALFASTRLKVIDPGKAES